jgi:hypothetical protein
VTVTMIVTVKMIGSGDGECDKRWGVGDKDIGQ